MIGVDSGQVIVTDPAYIGKGKYDLPSYDKITKVSLAGKSQLKSGAGIKLAVVSPSGMGDGVYPVYAVESDSHFGKRVSALVVDFELEKGQVLMAKLLERQAKGMT